METLKLVRECTFETKPIMEDINGQKQWALEGLGIKMLYKNGNERLYTREPMIEQLNIYIEDYLKQDRAVGELNHPKLPEDQIKVNPERIACKFIEVKIDGNDVYLKAIPTAGTPCGDLLIGLLNNKIKLGFSSRALAKLVKKTDYIETHCRKIITLADVVYDPSVGNEAFINGVLEEKNWVYENGIIMEAQNFSQVVEDVRHQFRNMTSKTKDQIVKKMMKQYFDALFKK